MSHRIRRQPSIFSVLWFRIALGVGVALVLALLVGPWVARWFGGDLPRSLFLLAPGGAARSHARPSGARSPEPPAVAARASRDPAAPPSDARLRRPRRRPARLRPAGRRTRAPSGTGRPACGSGSAARAVADRPPSTARRPLRRRRRPRSRAGRRAREAAPARPGSLAAPPAVYWVQVGAFLDHRNADRLAERLRGDGLSAATTSFEQSRVLYRVLLAGADGRHA